MTDVHYEDLFAELNEGLAIHELVTDEAGEAVNYRILEVNRRFEEILGLDREAVEGALATEAYDVEEPPFFERYRAVAETGESVEFETEFQPLGRHFHVSAFRPKPGRFATLFTDVTEQKETQAALEAQATRLEEEIERRKAAETRYRSLFENNPVVIWEEDYSEAKVYVDEIAAEHPDVAGYLEAHPEEIDELFARIDIVDVNRPAVEYYDAGSKAELMDNLDRLMTAESLVTNRQMWQAVANDQRHFRAETVSRTLEGRRRDEILEYRVPEEAAEDYSRVYVTAIDITERRDRERELERLTERLELALEGARLGVWDWNMETDRVYRDGRWNEMLGYGREAVTEDLDAFRKLVHPEDLGVHRAALEEHLEGAADFYQCTYRLRTAEGEWKWIQNVGKVVDWDGDTPLRAVGIHQDVDEKRRTRARLEQNNELLQAVDRILRHNLHNDMNVVQGYAMTIEKLGEGDLRDHARKIIDTSQKLLETVDKERRVVESLSDPLPVETIDLVPVVEAVIAGIDTKHPDAEIRLSAPEQVEARAVGSIGRAVEELLENAIVHGDSAPVVECEVGSGAGRAWIRVSDAGPRIPEMERAVLTEEGEITPLYHGSGFGLWLVNHVVERSDGQLSFDERVPRGNVVTVELKTPRPAWEPTDSGG
jgi:PAS domain S-box-containing protein